MMLQRFANFLYSREEVSHPFTELVREILILNQKMTEWEQQNAKKTKEWRSTRKRLHKLYDRYEKIRHNINKYSLEVFLDELYLTEDEIQMLEERGTNQLVRIYLVTLAVHKKVMINYISIKNKHHHLKHLTEYSPEELLCFF